MYGTNQDFRASASMNAVAIPSFVRVTGDTAYSTAAAQPNALANLLQKAWAALHRL
jgi:hypothetical protein